MEAFDKNHYAFSTGFHEQSVGNGLGQSFLDRWLLCHILDESDNLADSQNFTLRNIAKEDFSKIGEQMVFTNRPKVSFSDDHVVTVC